MAEFEIKISGVESVINQERRIKGKLLSACAGIEDCEKILKRSFDSGFGSVEKTLNNLNVQLSDIACKIGKMEDALEEVCGAYHEAETVLCQVKAERVKVTDIKNESVRKEFLPNGFSTISKIIKNFNSDAENPHAKTWASFFSMISSSMKTDEAESIAEWFPLYLGFTGSAIGFGGKFGKSIEALIKKYGTGSARVWLEKNAGILAEELKELGSIGNSFGFVSEYLKTIQDSDSMAAFLKNSGGWITSGGSLISSLEGLKKEIVNSTVDPVANLLTMGSYAAGEVINLAEDGRPMTLDDLSNLLLDTGLIGLKTGISQTTFGLIDMDADRSKGIFDKNIAWTADAISSLDIPLGYKVNLGFVATPVVAVASLGETFLDMGYQIGENINNFLYETREIFNSGTGSIGGTGGGSGGGGVR